MSCGAISKEAECLGNRQTPQKVVTIREHLDTQISTLREQLEKLCVAKAKADTLQMLDMPVDTIRSFVGWGI